MFNRVDSGTAVGAGLAGGGVVGEVSKDRHPQNLMDADVLFGALMPDFYLPLTGAIAIAGTVLLILSFIRASREKKKREQRDFINKG